MTKLRISELADQSGVPSTTLRYYEQVGLLPADRTPSGYRVYDDEAVERLRFIGAAKRMQLSLDSIRDLLRTWQDQSCRNVKAQLRPLVSGRLAETEQAISALNDLATVLRSGLDRLHALPDREHACDPSCAFLDNAAPLPTQPVDEACACDSEDPVFACSLSAQDHGERTARWQAVLAHTPIERVALGITALVSVDALTELVELVTAEQECCPFLDFQLNFQGRVVELRLTAPNEAAVPFVHALVPDTAR